MTGVDRAEHYTCHSFALSERGNGIATGYGTSIPSYDVQDIANKRLLDDEKPVAMAPHFGGFHGEYRRQEKTTGVYKRLSANRLEITELPVGLWTTDTKTSSTCTSRKKSKMLKIESHYSETIVLKFVLMQSKTILDDMLSTDNGNVKFESEFEWSQLSLSPSRFTLSTAEE